MVLNHDVLPITSRTDRVEMVALILKAREKELNRMQAEILAMRALLQTMRLRRAS